MGLSHSASNKYGMKMFSVSYQTFCSDTVFFFTSVVWGRKMQVGSSWSISVIIRSVRVELGNAYKKL